MPTCRPMPRPSTCTCTRSATQTAQIVLKHVSYGTVSGYEQVAAGDYTVAMRAAGAKPSSKPVLSTAVDVKAGRSYTVAGMGPAAGLRLAVIPDRLTTPRGKALVRVIQASMQQDTVTVTAGKDALAIQSQVRQRDDLPDGQPGYMDGQGQGLERDGDCIDQPERRLYPHARRAGRAGQAGHRRPAGRLGQQGGPGRRGTHRPGWYRSPAGRSAAAVGGSAAWLAWPEQ